jgi:hypothetical protein
MLDGYKVYNLSVGLPSMSVTQNGVAFNKTSVLKLEYAKHVLILTNEKEKLVAIQACDASTEGASPFYKGDKTEKVITARWNNKDLLKTLASMMSWNLREMGYKMEGEYIEKEGALIFDLNNATQIK